MSNGGPIEEAVTVPRGFTFRAPFVQNQRKSGYGAFADDPELVLEPLPVVPASLALWTWKSSSSSLWVEHVNVPPNDSPAMARTKNRFLIRITHLRCAWRARRSLTSRACT